jgi:predicted nucleotidyltransferase
MDPDAIPRTALRQAAARHPALRLLLVHGSRARGDEHAGSDWDLGYLADGPLDVGRLHADLAQVLGTDAVDLVDLARASALLRFEAARHGRVVVADPQDVHQRFVLEATLFWCDAGPVIERAHAAVLASLDR